MWTITPEDMLAMLILCEMRFSKANHFGDLTQQAKGVAKPYTAKVHKSHTAKVRRLCTKPRTKSHTKPRVKNTRITWCRCKEGVNCDHIPNGCEKCGVNYTPQRRTISRAGKTVVLCNACSLSLRNKAQR